MPGVFPPFFFWSVLGDELKGLRLRVDGRQGELHHALVSGISGFSGMLAHVWNRIEKKPGDMHLVEATFALWQLWQARLMVGGRRRQQELAGQILNRFLVKGAQWKIDISRTFTKYCKHLLEDPRTGQSQTEEDELVEMYNTMFQMVCENLTSDICGILQIAGALPDLLALADPVQTMTKSGVRHDTTGPERSWKKKWESRMKGKLCMKFEIASLWLPRLKGKLRELRGVAYPANYYKVEQARSFMRALLALKQARGRDRALLPSLDTSLGFPTPPLNPDDFKYPEDFYIVLNEREEGRAVDGDDIEALQEPANQWQRQKFAHYMMRAVAVLHSVRVCIGRLNANVPCLRFTKSNATVQDIGKLTGGTKVMLVGLTAARIFPELEDEKQEVLWPSGGPLPACCTLRSYPDSVEDYNADLWGGPAPELRLDRPSPQEEFRQQIGLPTDIWDAGMLIAQTWGMQPPGMTRRAAHTTARKGFFEDPQVDQWLDLPAHRQVPEPVKVALKAMLTCDAAQRPTAAELLANAANFGLDTIFPERLRDKAVRVVKKALPRSTAGYDERDMHAGGGGSWASDSDHDGLTGTTGGRGGSFGARVEWVPQVMRVSRALHGHPVYKEHCWLVHQNRDLRERIHAVRDCARAILDRT